MGGGGGTVSTLEESEPRAGGSASRKRKTWKDYVREKEEEEVRAKERAAKGGHGQGQSTAAKFNELDGYLRQGTESLIERQSKRRIARTKSRLEKLRSSLAEEGTSEGESKDAAANLYRGRVLVACGQDEHSEAAKKILEDAFFDVTVALDCREAHNVFLSEDGKFDCVLLDRVLPLGSAFELASVVREFEKKLRQKAAAQAAAMGKGVQPPTKRIPIICYTSQTSTEDLRLYMQSDMDGCVSYPVEQKSLLNTVRAAIPRHLAQLVPDPVVKSEEVRRYQQGPLGALEGSLDSASLAANQLSLSASMSEAGSSSGVVQIDPDTRVSYTVMDAVGRAHREAKEFGVPYFNLVICHDLFDTSERLKIFFKPIVEKYLGLQVLLWNYPGQAFTEWRSEQLLTSEYHAMCLNELLGQVGSRGSKEFDSSKPFYVLGYGFGANIATFYMTHYRVPNVRGLLLVNGWSFVDSNLAAALHDCINVFQCTPSARPDLPVYFFSRFLFSKEYLAKVSVPLALNLYTAVYNPISLAGRVSLCKGALASLDLRPLLGEIEVPLICIHSTQDALARSLHAEPFATLRAGEVRSIYQALQDPDKTCVIWVKSGHEIFQECRKQTFTLIEQILVGFHEKNDVSFPGKAVIDPSGLRQGTLLTGEPRQESLRSYLGEPSKSNLIEDKFIDDILDSLHRTEPLNRSDSPSSASTRRRTVTAMADSKVYPNGGLVPVDDSKETDFVFTTTGNQDQHQSSWSQFSQKAAVAGTVALEVAKKTYESQEVGGKTVKRRGGPRRNEGSVSIVIDPNTVAFERQDHVVYGRVTDVRPADPAQYPEVKEYMSWRLKRNRKRLQRLQVAARQIQAIYRGYRAKVYVEKLRRLRAALTIQRYYRGWRGRCRFLEQARRIWAAQLIQRVWRGFAGRLKYFELRVRIASAVNAQRVWRGHRSRRRVKKILETRYFAARAVQSLVRRQLARSRAWRVRIERNAAIQIQRVFRGNLGKRKAAAERDKYIFSRSQTQGIEFGRQMLLEHKLHATRLQSDVTLLSQEKVNAEEQVEALLEEISSFEEGVRILEKEMHQLSKVESEAAAYLDDQSKGELREQKMRLDKEFGEMLLKIGNRKEMLNSLEQQLSAIDKARQTKEEELRTLERKLVVLLEEQQNELNAIKRKQDIRGALLAASHEQIVQASGLATLQDGSASVDGSMSSALVPVGGNRSVNVVGGGGGGGSGPSIQERRQAGQLMQSAETLMKFGFMSMSMTYFSSLNMIKALRTVSAQDTVMAALADVHAQRAANFGADGGQSVGAGLLGGALGAPQGQGKGQFLPELKPGQLPGQEPLRVSAWSVDDVCRWLQTLALAQYSEAFRDAAVDGEFLYDLNDEDLKNTLGVEHRLHRKKILNCIYRLKIAEAQRDSRIDAFVRGTDLAQAPVCRLYLKILYFSL